MTMMRENSRGPQIMPSQAGSKFVCVAKPPQMTKVLHWLYKYKSNKYIFMGEKINFKHMLN